MQLNKQEFVLLITYIHFHSLKWQILPSLTYFFFCNHATIIIKIFSSCNARCIKPGVEEPDTLSTFLCTPQFWLTVLFSHGSALLFIFQVTFNFTDLNCLRRIFVSQILSVLSSHLARTQVSIHGL